MLLMFTDIVYRYDYERAVREGYLVDYDVVKVRSDITMNGLFLKPGEEVGLKDTVTGRMTFEVLEDEREFDTTDLEAKVTAPDRNRKIVKEFAKYALKQENEQIELIRLFWLRLSEGSLFPKTQTMNLPLFFYNA